MVAMVEMFLFMFNGKSNFVIFFSYIDFLIIVFIFINNQCKHRKIQRSYVFIAICIRQKKQSYHMNGVLVSTVSD